MVCNKGLTLNWETCRGLCSLIPRPSSRKESLVNVVQRVLMGRVPLKLCLWSCLWAPVNWRQGCRYWSDEQDYRAPELDNQFQSLGPAPPYLSCHRISMLLHSVFLLITCTTVRTVLLSMRHYIILCILNCLMLPSLPCLHAFAVPLSLHVITFYSSIMCLHKELSNPCVY